MAKDLREINRRLFEAFDVGKLEVLEELISPDFVDHAAPPGVPAGFEGVRQVAQMMQNALTGQRREILDTILDRNVVVTRARLTAKHTGDLLGIPATGRDISIENVHIFKFRNGRAVEHWGLMDQPALMEQLGMAMPTPPSQ